MKIDDKEIEKLLEEFKSEDIKVPDELSEKLDLKLKKLRPKKYKRWLSVSVASALVLLTSYSIIPSFRSFGDTVFKYIFSDIGVENAVNSGYKSGENQKIIIGDYDISIENIYIDDLRISFDAIIENDVKDMENRSSLYVEGIERDEIAINNGVFYRDDEKLKANVLLIGDGVAKLIENKSELQVELKLVKHNDTKDEVLGKSDMTIKIPKDIKMSKSIEINKTIKENDLTLDIQKLEVSPTMMYLYTSGKVEGIGEIQGLRNVRIMSDSGKVYKENISLAGTGTENGWKQTIVPSVYYDKSKQLRLKTDGAFIDATKEVNINLKDSYPKVIDYFGHKITINQVKYENNRLTVEVLKNDIFDHKGSSYIDGDSPIEGYFDGEIHGIVFDIDKRDNYDLSLGLILKYELPINIQIENILIEK